MQYFKLAFLAGLTLYGTVQAAPILLFSTGNPDGLMAAATRPDLGGKIEIETGDDFLFSSAVHITSATFTGLITGTGSTIGDVVVEIYRIFPLDSDTVRTPQVVTRNNSPSDVALDSRDAAASELTFSTTALGSFTASNSVLNGINKAPNQTTGGEGSVTGQEVRFTVNFATPFDLASGHYFFVPQVQVTGGEFYWLSAPKPITGGTGPFVGDLQAWIRNENLAPDWSRIGTDIVGGTTPPQFNMTFSLTGEVVPEPSTLAMLGIALVAAGALRRCRQ